MQPPMSPPMAPPPATSNPTAHPPPHPFPTPPRCRPPPPPRGVAHPETPRFRFRRMAQQDFVNLPGPDLFSAAIDEFLEAPGKREIALCIQEALVTGAKPTVGERFGIRFRVVLI